jgi:hypothetical protein
MNALKLKAQAASLSDEDLKAVNALLRWFLNFSFPKELLQNKGRRMGV